MRLVDVGNDVVMVFWDLIASFGNYPNRALGQDRALLPKLAIGSQKPTLIANSPLLSK